MEKLIERIVQLRLVGFVDVRDIKTVIDSLYESAFIVNFSEKESNNSLMYRIVKSFYNVEGVEKTTRADILIKDKKRLKEIHYKYTNVYTSIDDIGVESIDEKMHTKGFTKLSFKFANNENVDDIKDAFKTIASNLNIEGYIIDADILKSGKEIKGSEYIKPEVFEIPDAV